MISVQCRHPCKQFHRLQLQAALDVAAAGAPLDADAEEEAKEEEEEGVQDAAIIKTKGPLICLYINRVYRRRLISDV